MPQKIITELQRIQKLNTNNQSRQKNSTTLRRRKLDSSIKASRTKYYPDIQKCVLEEPYGIGNQDILKQLLLYKTAAQKESQRIFRQR